MYYQNKGHPIDLRDHVFDVVTKVLWILIIAGCIMTFLTIGIELLKIIWIIYINISETLQVTLFMINKKIDLNI